MTKNISSPQSSLPIQWINGDSLYCLYAQQPMQALLLSYGQQHALDLASLMQLWGICPLPLALCWNMFPWNEVAFVAPGPGTHSPAFSNIKSMAVLVV